MESAPGHTPLIHGLPDEIALICLARVPRRFHNVLRCVSKRWRELLCSEEWHICRKRNNLDESWIYVICRETGIKCYVLAPDLSSRSMRVMHIIEPPCSGRQGVTIEALDKRLFFLGGCSCLNDATDEVYCYDASSNRWSTAAPMPTPRKIYVIGRGLSVVAVDMDTAARVDGFLVTTSTGPLVEQDLSPERSRVITI